MGAVPFGRAVVSARRLTQFGTRWSSPAPHVYPITEIYMRET